MLGAVNAMRRLEAQFAASFDDTLTGEWEVGYGRFETALKRADLPRGDERRASRRLQGPFGGVQGRQRRGTGIHARRGESERRPGHHRPGRARSRREGIGRGRGGGRAARGGRSADPGNHPRHHSSRARGGLASAIFVGRTTAKPLGRLRDAMLGLAAGDLEAEIPALGRADEIGQMARAVATFKEAALDRGRLEREALDATPRPAKPSARATKPSARRAPASRSRSSPSSRGATSNCRGAT